MKRKTPAARENTNTTSNTPAAAQNGSTRALERLLMNRDNALGLECGDTSPLYHDATRHAFQTAADPAYAK